MPYPTVAVNPKVEKMHQEWQERPGVVAQERDMGRQHKPGLIGEPGRSK
jgi:hypothetical protein